MRVSGIMVLAVVLLGSGTARAHQQGVSYSDIEIADGRVRFDLVLSTHDLVGGGGTAAITDDDVLRQYPQLRSAFSRAIVVEAGGQACPLVLQDYSIEPNDLVVFRLRGPCPDAQPVRIAIRLMMLSAADGYNLAKIRAGGVFEEHIFTRKEAETTIAASAGGMAASLGSTFRRFFVLGVEHIATGYDHILFLLALLLVGGGLRSVVAIVTAFTVAHSITLSLAVLDIVQLPSRLVESAIALSIAWVALENLVIDQSRGRWRITFGFGLMHGFGFASILREMHLPAQGLLTSLFAFNLGVEAGQLVVVLVTYPFVTLLQRSPHRRLLIGLASGVILVLALWWFVQRAFA